MILKHPESDFCQKIWTLRKDKLFTEATYRQLSFDRFYFFNYFNKFPKYAGRRASSEHGYNQAQYHWHKSLEWVCDSLPFTEGGGFGRCTCEFY